MKKMPSANSVLVFMIFMILMINTGGKQVEDGCARVIKSYYTWNVFIPIYSTLFGFSIRGLINIKDFKQEFLTFMLFSVVPLYIFFSVIYRVVTYYLGF